MRDRVVCFWMGRPPTERNRQWHRVVCFSLVSVLGVFGVEKSVRISFLGEVEGVVCKAIGPFFQAGFLLEDTNSTRASVSFLLPPFGISE